MRLGTICNLPALMIVLSFGLAACVTAPSPSDKAYTDSIVEGLAGQSYTVFFNTTNRIVYPTTGHKIRIVINGKDLGLLHGQEYVALQLQPGTYQVMLSHWDMRSWREEHELVVSNNGGFVQIWSSIVGNEMKVVDSLPKDFSTTYTAGLGGVISLE